MRGLCPILSNITDVIMYEKLAGLIIDKTLQHGVRI